jgi:hypothetical protein
LGERLLCKQEVVGSIPITSTTERATRSVVRRELRQRCACTARAAAAGRASRAIGNDEFAWGTSVLCAV